jgi:sRNA-binding carbon storage regulator CsrA
VCVKVVAVSGNKVRLGIIAPADVAIRRGELDFFRNSGDRMRNAANIRTVDFRI